MPTNILMPALSPTMEKGNLAKWLKKEGDQIKSGDVIAEIETDKATMEVEAVDEGVLAKIVVPEGTADVPVNDVIAVIAGEGEDAKALGAAGAAPSAKKAEEKPNQWQWREGAAASDRARSTAATTDERCRPRLRLAISAPDGKGSGARSRIDPRLRPAWPRRRARREGCDPTWHGEESASGGARRATWCACTQTRAGRDVRRDRQKNVRARLVRRGAA